MDCHAAAATMNIWLPDASASASNAGDEQEDLNDDNNTMDDDMSSIAILDHDEEDEEEEEYDMVAEDSVQDLQEENMSMWLLP